MKLLRLAMYAEPRRGGRERHVTRLTSLQAADPRYDEVTLVTSRPATELEGASLIEVPSFPWGPSLLRTSWFSAAATLAPHPTEADIVHVHGDFVEAWGAEAIARQTGAAKVLTLHGRLSRRHAHRTARIARRFDSVIVVSPTIRDRLVECGFSRADVHVIPSGVEPHLISAKRASRVGRVRIVMVGSLIDLKGFDIALRVLADVEADLDFTVEVVGDGPNRQALEELAGRNVHFRGWLARDEVEEILLRSDIAVFPSVDLLGAGEGTPTAMLEAMAAGCAVAASRVGGMPAALGHGSSGLLVDPGSEQALGEALGALIRDDSLRDRLSRHAREQAQLFAWPKAAEAIYRVYTGALLERSR